MHCEDRTCLVLLEASGERRGRFSGDVRGWTNVSVPALDTDDTKRSNLLREAGGYVAGLSASWTWVIRLASGVGA
jgi:hypothetical protein